MNLAVYFSARMLVRADSIVALATVEFCAPSATSVMIAFDLPCAKVHG